MKMNRSFRETSREIERRLEVLENLIESLQEAVEESRIRLDQRGRDFSPSILPRPRRLPGVWRRRVNPGLN